MVLVDFQFDNSDRELDEMGFAIFKRKGRKKVIIPHTVTHKEGLDLYYLMDLFRFAEESMDRSND